MKGFGHRMDDYYTDPRAEYFVTVRDRKLRFHDDSDEKHPDWKLQQALLLTIKGCQVAGVGVEQYWITGKLECGLQGADFGQYMDVHEYKAIAAALPFMWSDKAHWYHDKRDKPWDVFVPFIQAWNDKQKALFLEYGIAVTDESMFAWVPNTSKLGGLPNYTLEPRKPKPLGTMLKDTAECKTGILLFTDPVMAPSVQDKKPFSQSKSQSPMNVGKK
jgi:Transposase IS4